MSRRAVPEHPQPQGATILGANRLHVKALKSWSGLMVYGNVTLVPAARIQLLSPQLLPAAPPSGGALTPPSAALSPHATWGPALPPLCKLLPPATLQQGVPALVNMEDAGILNGKAQPSDFTRGQGPQLPAVLVMRADAQLESVPAVANPTDEITLLMSFSTAQAVLGRPIVVLGYPQGSLVLDLMGLPAAFSLRTANASLVFRDLVLAGLAPAGLHPTARGGSSSSTPVTVANSTATISTTTRNSNTQEHMGLSTSPPLAPSQPSSAGNGSKQLPAARRRRRRTLSQHAQGTPHRQSGPGPWRAVGPRRRRLTQVASAFPAGVSPTGGLAPSLANLTSCLWAVDFDRAAEQVLVVPLPAGPGAPPAPLPWLPRVFLD